MIGYTTLGSNDFEKARAFYDALLPELGGKRAMGFERMQLYSGKNGGGMVAVCSPYDEKPASVGNGTMVALNAATRQEVDRTYAKAIALGGSDEGPPGLRGETFYGAYFRDLDGNKLCVFKVD
ncbi:MAG: VOC family protein [Caulobacteraceae bacterium]